MFFEAHLFGANATSGSNFVSFTTNAFVDKLGYEEPKLSETTAHKLT